MSYEQAIKHLERSTHKVAIKVAKEAIRFHYEMVIACWMCREFADLFPAAMFHMQAAAKWQKYMDYRRSLIVPWWKYLLKPIGLVFGYLSKGSDLYLPL